MRLTTIVLVTQAGCAMGAGSVAFGGGPDRFEEVGGGGGAYHPTVTTCHDTTDFSSSNRPTDPRMSHWVPQICTTTGGSSAPTPTPGTSKSAPMDAAALARLTAEPDHAPFNMILGLKEGYASASYATGMATGTTPAPGGSMSARNYEVYLDASYMGDRFGLTLELGYASQALSDGGDFGFSAWPVSLIGDAGLGPLTVFGGVGLLKSASLGDSDLGGYRFLGGIKGRVFRVHEVDVDPRLELQSTHASADGGFSYSATGVSFAVELGF